MSSRKAGRTAKCPKCGEPITVPTGESDRGSAKSEKPSHKSGEAGSSDSATPAAGPDSSADVTASNSSDDLYSQLSFLEADDGDWVYEDDGREMAVVDPTKVAVPRNVIYMQGVLLAAVGLVCLVLGILIGQMTGGRSTAQAAPTPCTISGSVTFEGSSGDPFPDIGCVVIALPKGRKPERNSKPEFDQIGPTAAVPDRRDPPIATIISLGGDYARADANGQFKLDLPDSGQYYLLVVSSNAERGEGDELQKPHLAQMGDYFNFDNGLLYGRKYEWRNLAIRKDRSMQIVF
ncbi:MAG: hypothetical protein QGG36_16820 [Pirellulaceae bacterium]|nr:hypothetical protein [Pirellulaceae bacterium]